MNSDDPISLWIQHLKEGDDDAAEAIWKVFFDRVCHLAIKKMSNMPQRVKDEEDIALSALNALCVGAREGRFRQLENREDLWQLLAMITSRKAIDAWRRTSRRPELGESALDGGGYGNSAEGSDHAPEDAAMLDSLSVTCEELIESLEPNLQTVALLKLAGHSNAEVSESIGRSVVSVERYLKMIRAKWRRHLS